MISKQETAHVLPEPRQETRPSYHAPEMFSVGETVELIQGAQWRGPLDHSSSWPIWAL